MKNQAQLVGDPEVEKKIVERVKEQAIEDEAGKRALKTPLPGAVADAFAIAPEIKVGEFSIRPFYDIDFEFLQTLQHPLHKMMVQGMKGDSPEDNNYFPRGSMAWELAYIFTTPPDEVEEELKKGVENVRAIAKKKFSRFRLVALSLLSQAVMKQMTIYWSPSISYGEESKGEASNAQENPT